VFGKIGRSFTNSIKIKVHDIVFLGHEFSDANQRTFQYLLMCVHTCLKQLFHDIVPLVHNFEILARKRHGIN